MSFKENEMYDINKSTRNSAIDYYCRIEGIDYEYFMYTIEKRYRNKEKPRRRSEFFKLLFINRKVFKVKDSIID